MIAACGAAGSSVPWFLGVTVSGVVQGGPFLLHAFITGPLYMLLWPAGLHPRARLPRPAAGRRTRHRWLVPLVYALSLGGYVLARCWSGWSRRRRGWTGSGPGRRPRQPSVVPVLALALGLFVSELRPRRGTPVPDPDAVGHHRGRCERGDRARRVLDPGAGRSGNRNLGGPAQRLWRSLPSSWRLGLGLFKETLALRRQIRAQHLHLLHSNYAGFEIAPLAARLAVGQICDWNLSPFAVRGIHNQPVVTAVHRKSLRLEHSHPHRNA